MRKKVKVTIFVLIVIIIFNCFRYLKPITESIKGFSVIKENQTIVQKEIGDEVLTNTYKLKVINIEEVQSISSYYGSNADASHNKKFVLIALQLTNITNATFNFSPELIIIDNKDREFNSYYNTIDNINNYIDNRELLPGVTETGYLVYELPNDSVSYSICIGDEEIKSLIKLHY